MNERLVGFVFESSVIDMHTLLNRTWERTWCIFLVWLNCWCAFECGNMLHHCCTTECVYFFLWVFFSFNFYIICLCSMQVFFFTLVWNSTNVSYYLDIYKNSSTYNLILASVRVLYNIFFYNYFLAQKKYKKKPTFIWNWITEHWFSTENDS